LKPFEDRRRAEESAQALIHKIFGESQQIRTAMIIPFNLPPIIGLSTGGGFEYQLEALEGQDPVDMGGVVQGVMDSANQDPRLARDNSIHHVAICAGFVQRAEEAHDAQINVSPLCAR
jgi:multidrug efflux pump subunit AcrB